MKVLQVSGTDIIGGAGIAAYRLHQGLRQSDVDSYMLVARKATSDPTVHRFTSRMSRWGRLQARYASQRHSHQLKRHPRKSDSAYWSLNNCPYPIADVINAFQADVVHLHWVGDNYLPIHQIAKIKAPIVWTLHDMWGFTGGCHYAGDCTAYHTACGNCPQFIHPQPNDISQQIIQQKLKAWFDIPMTIVCPSHWLADCARNSVILRNKTIEVIPNGIDTGQYKPIEKHSARQAFNLPVDKKLILFGAFGGTDDLRKGFSYLRDALKLLPENTNIELVVFGGEQAQHLEVSLRVHQVGRLQDNVSIALLYSACDVFVLPSLQDNLPNTLLESLACGTPGVAFDSAGIPDLIRHKHNGYLAQLRDTQDLLSGIRWALDESLPPTMIHQDIVKHYALPHIAERHHQLYHNL